MDSAYQAAVFPPLAESLTPSASGPMTFYASFNRLGLAPYASDFDPDPLADEAPDRILGQLDAAAANALADNSGSVNVPSYDANRFADCAAGSETPGAAKFFNTLFPVMLSQAKNRGPVWFTRTDLNLSLTSTYKPLYVLSTIQPFQFNEQSDLLFWQSQLSTDSTGTTHTLNLGAGYRKLLGSQNRLIGFNGFYDYSRDKDLARASLGMEYFIGQLETRLNGYFSLPGAGPSSAGQTSPEWVASGYDLKIGGPLPDLPWLTLYATSQVYFHDTAADEVIFQLQTGMRLTPHCSLKAGYALDTTVISVTFNYTFRPTSLPTMQTYKNGPNDIKVGGKLFQKVQRDNTIHTQT